MTKTVKYSSAFVLGLVVCGLLVFVMMPVLMFQTHQSRYGFEETVAIAQANVEEQGWVHSGTSYFHKSIAKHGGGEIPPVAVLKVCHPEYAERILARDEYRHLSTLMPCSIAVYEGDDGQVYVSHFNTALMGMMFGDPVREVMAGPVKDFLAAVVATVKK